MLDVTERGVDLSSANYLPEYDLILVQPSRAIPSEPDNHRELPDDAYHFFRHQTNIRTEELKTFIERAGILVVLLEPPGQISDPSHEMEMDNYQWWTAALPFPAAGAAWWFLVDSGRGAMEVRSFGHPFEDYLKSVGQYQVRIKPDAVAFEGATVLARNRADEPTAVEANLAGGTVVLVPPPRSEDDWRLLHAGIDRLLYLQLGRPSAWPLRAEDELRNAVVANQREARERDEGLRGTLADVIERKKQVLAIEPVARAMSYWEEATRTTATPQTALPWLYKIVEVLKDRYGGESGASKVTGVSANALERIAQLANEAKFDIRHAPDQKTVKQDIDITAFDKAFKDAHLALQGMIEHEFAAL